MAPGAEHHQLVCVDRSLVLACRASPDEPRHLTSMPFTGGRRLRPKAEGDKAVPFELFFDLVSSVSPVLVTLALRASILGGMVDHETARYADARAAVRLGPPLLDAPCASWSTDEFRGSGRSVMP